MKVKLSGGLRNFTNKEMWIVCDKYLWLAASPDHVISESISVVEVKTVLVFQERD